MTYKITSLFEHFPNFSIGRNEYSFLRWQNPPFLVCIRCNFCQNLSNILDDVNVTKLSTWWKFFYCQVAIIRAFLELK